MLMPTTEWKPKATTRHENVLWLTSLLGDEGWFEAISSVHCQHHPDGIIVIKYLLMPVGHAGWVSSSFAEVHRDVVGGYVEKWGKT